jgi:hypothetical protein
LKNKTVVLCNEHFVIEKDTVQIYGTLFDKSVSKG